MAQTVKRLPTMLEIWVQTLGRGDLLEKEMATHSSLLAWKMPWMEEPGRLQSMGCKESDRTERLHFHFSLMEAKSSLKIFSYKYLILGGGVFFCDLHCFCFL